MAKTKLLVWHKDELTLLAKRNVVSKPTQKDLDRAYKAAASGLRKVIDTKFPPDEMEVLTKHGVSRPDKCIRVVSPSSQVQQFDYSKDDAPILPSKYCASRNFPVSQSLFEKIEAWDSARDEHKKTVHSILADYRAVIHSCRTVEDVIEVWPGCESLAVGFLKANTTQLPAALSPEVLGRVKSSNIQVSS